jgi:iron complex outermembrane receptor protein
MNHRRRLLLGGVALAAPLAFAGAARAVDATAGAAASDAAVGEVVVTAFKREVTAQHVPASISAVSSDTLARQGIQDVRDLSKVIPNLNWGEHFGTTLVTIRGVGSNVDSGITEPTIAMYVDGVYLPRSDMATLRAVDLDRVEVLRGPQGTLYGRNATGGAINFVAAAPTHGFSAEADISGGSRGAYGVSGFVSGPVAPDLYVRLSGGHDHDDGYVRVVNTGQHLNGVNDTYGRLAVRYEPTADLSADLSVRYDRNTAANAYQQLFEPSPVAPPSGQTTAPNQIYGDAPFGGKTDLLVVAGALNWKLSDNLKLRSVTGFVDHHSHFAIDDDSTTTPLEYTDDFTRPSRSYSEELDLFGDYARFKWIAGLFYFHEDARVVLPVILGPSGATPPSPGLALGEASKIDNVALFGDLTWSVSERLRLELGLRYNHESNNYDEFWTFTGAPSTSGHFKVNRDKVLPKVAVQYDVAPDATAYAQWSLGYKSGGSNLPSGGGDILPLYQPETISAWELGLKSQFLDRRVTANLAAFYYRYHGLQVTTDVPPAGTIVQNANANVYGLEAELQWRATDRLTFDLDPTYLHARFDRFSSFDATFLTTVNLDGKPVERAPDFTLNFGARYRIDLGNTLFSKLYLQGGGLYSSTVVLRYYNDAPGQSQPAYVVGNLSATLANAGEDLKLTVFINNISNTDYKQQITNFGLGNMGNYGPPRTVGARLSKRF